MNLDLTRGNITQKMWRFALPLMLGNLLQQVYNIADTLIVGRVLGPDALAAVGASYTLMTFVTSILLGLCMGCGAFFSIQFGRRDFGRLRNGAFLSFVLIGMLAVTMNAILFFFSNPIIRLLQIPLELREMTRTYLLCVFVGLMATYLYNFFANLLRAIGNSIVPLAFLSVASGLNILLDILFVYYFQWGIRGAAIATVLCQFFSGIGVGLYGIWRFPQLRVHRSDMKWNRAILRDLTGLSLLTAAQQSIMNFGILMVQGLVNSFGGVVMAAFAAAVKIDTLAYMPAQDFGNAFSTFVAQNFGARQPERIRRGLRQAILCVFFFCLAISAAVCLFARLLMGIFIEDQYVHIIQVGVEYLHIEAACYFGIGLLFLLYGFYRAVNRPGMSVVLTVCSLGTRVALAYILSAVPTIGVTGIWAAIPIGWFLADTVGMAALWWRDKHPGKSAGANSP